MDNLLFALKLSFMILINEEKAKEFIEIMNSFQNIKKRTKKISAYIAVFGSMFFLLLYKSLNMMERLKKSWELAYLDGLLSELILLFAVVLSTLIVNKIVLFSYYFILIFKQTKTENSLDNMGNNTGDGSLS